MLKPCLGELKLGRWGTIIFMCHLIQEQFNPGSETFATDFIILKETQFYEWAIHWQMWMKESCIYSII